MLCRIRLLSLAAAALLLASQAGAGAESAQAEPLLEWTPVIAEAIQTATSAPCLASRNLAIIYAAAFDAINAADPAYHPYAFQGEAPEGTEPSLAGIAAIALAAETYFPSHRAVFARLRDRHFSQLGAGRRAEEQQRSIAFGRSVAQALIDARADDGSTASQTYYPKDETGKWKRTPPRYRPPELSYWSRMRPFVIESAEAYRLPPPPALESQLYAEAFQEIAQLGAAKSATRTPDQTEIAVFWSCFSYTSTPAGHWYEIATRLARSEKLALLESARLLALTNLAMADAGLVCWDTKYTYEFWRPIHAIRGADQDGNPATTADPKWDSLLESPPHPEYASGHGAFSGAGSKILELFFDAADGYAFSTTSSSLPGVVRQYRSFSECTDEILMSRVYGGIHFRFSNEGGRKIGEQVAAYTFSHCLQPVAGEPASATLAQQAR